MLANALYPKELAPNELDAFLEKGWFRMSQNIFTTNFIRFNNQQFSTIWLRINLNNYTKSATHKKLLKQNRIFKYKVAKATITQEKDDLFSKYKQSITFETSESLTDLLFGSNTDTTIYNTYEICVYDNKRLIALGFFDLGNKYTAGISCIYDPEYKKYSLGKYLMYLKIEYCLTINQLFFYPGYFVPGYKLFDYKLELAKENLEYFNLHQQCWLPYKDYTDKQNPLMLMKYKLILLQAQILEQGYKLSILNYRFFDASLMPTLFISQLLDYPVFLFIADVDQNNMMPLVVFDVQQLKYKIIQCMSVWQTGSSDELSTEYASNLLQNVEVLYEDSSTHHIIKFLVGEI